MIYTKQALTLEDQADLLISRNLQANKTELIEILQHISYYRLSGYLYPFKKTISEEIYQDNTTLEKIVNLYRFDSDLRNLLLKAIEKIEVSIRSNLAYYFTNDYGPFEYVNYDKKGFLGKVHDASKNSKENFVKHFWEKYGNSHTELPFWMVIEIISFGTVVTFYKTIKFKTKKKVSKVYGVSCEVLDSWLMTLNIIRNICAHHGRLWNKKLIGLKPTIPEEKNNPEWYINSVPLNNNKIFIALTIMKFLLDTIKPENNWKTQLKDLLKKYSDVNISDMGFPSNWEEHPLWT